MSCEAALFFLSDRTQGEEKRSEKGKREREKERGKRETKRGRDVMEAWKSSKNR